MGRLTADPELRQTQSGVASCRFTVAVNRKFADKSTGERQADFITCVAWRQTAEFVSRYFSKGKMIALDGELRNNNYKDRTHPDVTHFNRQLDYETMMITLKSKFVETPELLELVKLLGTITEENSAQLSDDGFTQTVVVRKGIAIKDNKAVKPIVNLKPYRTFNEVEQPESQFLLRLSEGGYVALYEADGGAWKLQARRNVADYLKSALADLIEAGRVIVVE